jgi:hypothetical protein
MRTDNVIIPRLRAVAGIAVAALAVMTATSPTTADGAVAETGQPDGSAVLFQTDNDDCADIDNGQAHPDWIEGQANSGLNTDGTPTYGFAYNTGDSTIGEISWGFVTDSRAHSGDCMLAMGIADAYDNKRAIRIFRRYDRDGNSLPAQAYYSTWFYFPDDITVDGQAQIGGQTVYGFWNIFQIKNRVGGQSLSAISVNAGKQPGDDHMVFYLWLKTPCGPIEECGQAFGIDQLNPVPIPTGRWVHLELYLDARTDSGGQLTLWQDGQAIVKHRGITERAGTERREWSVNNYGTLHTPSTHTLYVDDARIATTPVHPELFPTQPVITQPRFPGLPIGGKSSIHVH